MLKLDTCYLSFLVSTSPGPTDESEESNSFPKKGIRIKFQRDKKDYQLRRQFSNHSSSLPRVFQKTPPFMVLYPTGAPLPEIVYFRRTIEVTAPRPPLDPTPKVGGPTREWT